MNENVQSGVIHHQQKVTKRPRIIPIRTSREDDDRVTQVSVRISEQGRRRRDEGNDASRNWKKKKKRNKDRKKKSGGIEEMEWRREVKIEEGFSSWLLRSRPRVKFALNTRWRSITSEVKQQGNKRPSREEGVERAERETDKSNGSRTQTSQ